MATANSTPLGLSGLSRSTAAAHARSQANLTLLGLIGRAFAAVAETAPKSNNETGARLLEELNRRGLVLVTSTDHGFRRDVGLLRPQAGFTLIELMIVVAIVAILAAIAVPAYLNYTVRSKVTEGLNLASAVEVDVADAYTSGGMPGVLAFATNYNALPATPSKYVQAIAVDGASGEITVTFADPKIMNDTVRLTPNEVANGVHVALGLGDPGSPLDWACTGAMHATADAQGFIYGAGATLPLAYAPKSCT